MNIMRNCELWHQRMKYVLNDEEDTGRGRNNVTICGNIVPLLPSSVLRWYYNWNKNWPSSVWPGQKIVLDGLVKKKKKKANLLIVSFSYSFFLFHRHSTKLELHSHVVLGPESLRHLLHLGRTWTLLHRRVHSVLHHHQTLPVLPHSSQHPGLPAEPTSSHLVPHVLLLRVQRQRARPQRVLLALLPAHCDEEADWIMNSISDTVGHFSACARFRLLCQVANWGGVWYLHQQRRRMWSC